MFIGGSRRSLGFFTCVIFSFNVMGWENKAVRDIGSLALVTGLPVVHAAIGARSQSAVRSPGVLQLGPVRAAPSILSLVPPTGLLPGLLGMRAVFLQLQMVCLDCFNLVLSCVA